MAQITLITGGSRSGKSAYAQKLAETQPDPRIYLATGPVLDDEMRERVRRHQQARQTGRWRTIEETLRLDRVLDSEAVAGVVLVDCLTLWINNLMHAAEQRNCQLTEEDIARQCGEVMEAARRCASQVIFVTNEVGMGIVPANAAARRFRDLAGRCNQIVAAAADTVVLVVCGLPLKLK